MDKFSIENALFLGLDRGNIKFPPKFTFLLIENLEDATQSLKKYHVCFLIS